MSKLANVLSQIKQISVIFTHFVGRGSESHIRVDENLNYVALSFNS